MMDMLAFLIQAAPEDPVTHDPMFGIIDMRVVVVYSVALALAIFLDWRFGKIRWYWHVAAIALALTLGFMRPLEGLAGPKWDIAVGALFTFLFVWGISEFFFKVLRIPHHR
jgi:hypothetical protein